MRNSLYCFLVILTIGSLFILLTLDFILSWHHHHYYCCHHRHRHCTCTTSQSKMRAGKTKKNCHVIVSSKMFVEWFRCEMMCVCAAQCVHITYLIWQGCQTLRTIVFSFICKWFITRITDLINFLTRIFLKTDSFHVGDHSSQNVWIMGHDSNGKINVWFIRLVTSENVYTLWFY